MLPRAAKKAHLRSRSQTTSRARHRQTDRQTDTHSNRHTITHATARAPTYLLQSRAIRTQPKVIVERAIPGLHRRTRNHTRGIGRRPLPRRRTQCTLHPDRDHHAHHCTSNLSRPNPNRAGAPTLSTKRATSKKKTRVLQSRRHRPTTEDPRDPHGPQSKTRKLRNLEPAEYGFAAARSLHGGRLFVWSLRVGCVCVFFVGFRPGSSQSRFFTLTPPSCRCASRHGLFGLEGGAGQCG